MKEKKPIPEMPTDIKELEELSKKQFRVLSQSTPVAVHGREAQPGEIGISSETLECPFCDNRFSATRREGCFGGITIPTDCPNCGFPEKVYDALVAALHAKKKKEEGDSK